MAVVALLGLPLVSAAGITENNNDSIASERRSLGKAAGYTAVYYGGAMFLMSKTWYKGRETVPFHFYNDNKGWLQVDKFGHAFGAYLYSCAGYEFLLNSGCSKKEALMYGATLGFILQAPIEIMDGIHEGYGFSGGDFIANFLGSALVLGQELLFNEQVVRYKFSYHETGYSHKANGYLGSTALNRVLKDYNGHTYWLSMPVKVICKSESIPPWLNVAVGYGAKGMYGEFENIMEYKGVPIPEAVRYRQFYLSPDIDWTKFNTGSRFLRKLFSALNLVKFPLPALEFNSTGKVKGYWLYF